MSGRTKWVSAETDAGDVMLYPPARDDVYAVMVYGSKKAADEIANKLNNHDALVETLTELVQRCERNSLDEWTEVVLARAMLNTESTK